METRTGQGDSLDCLFPLRQLQKMHAARAFASNGESVGTLVLYPRLSPNQTYPFLCN
jgi:hypothetical protein